MGKFSSAQLVADSPYLSNHTIPYQVYLYSRFTHGMRANEGAAQRHSKIKTDLQKLI